MANESLLTRGIRILEELSAHPEPRRFSELQRDMGNVSPTTLNRALKTLTKKGVIEKSPAGGYQLSSRVYFWGIRAGKGSDFIAMAQEQINRLSAEFSATCTLIRPAGENIQIAYRRTDPYSPALSPAGTLNPMRFPVLGCVFFVPMDQWTEERIRYDLSHPYRKSISIEEALDIVENSWQNFVFNDRGKLITGTYRLAAPVLHHGEVCFCIGMGLAPERGKDRDLIMTASERLNETARLLSTALDS